MCGCYRFHSGVHFPFLKTGSFWARASLPPTQSDANRCRTETSRVTWHPPCDETGPSVLRSPPSRQQAQQSRARGHAPRAHRRWHALRLDAQPQIAPSLCPRPPTDRSPRASQVSSKSGVPCLENKPLLCCTSKKMPSPADDARHGAQGCANSSGVLAPRRGRVPHAASAAAPLHLPPANASMCEGAHGTTHGAQSRWPRWPRWPLPCALKVSCHSPASPSQRTRWWP